MLKNKKKQVDNENNVKKEAKKFLLLENLNTGYYHHKSRYFLIDFHNH